MTRGVRRLLRLYDALVLGFAGVAMAMVVAVMTAQVFYRYALNDSLIWAEEVCRYILVAMTFLLIGVAYRRGDMVGVQAFTTSLPARARRALAIPVHVLMIGFLIVVAYYGYSFARFNGTFAIPAVDFILGSLTGRPSSGAVSMYWIYLLIPIGCLILATHVAASLARIWRDSIEREP